MPSPTKRLAPEVRAALDNLQRQINDQGSKLQAQQELLWVLVDTHPNPEAVLERFRAMGETVVEACRESQIPEQQIRDDEIARFWLGRLLDPHSTKSVCTTH